MSATSEPAPLESAPPGRGRPVELSRAEIDAFLEAQRIARIGCHVDGLTYVVPVIYAYDGQSLYAITTEGQKVTMMRAEPRVCVEVDEYDADGRGSWRSVIGHGRYEELAGEEVERALELLRGRFARAAAEGPARSLGPSVVAFRIRLAEVTGRAVSR